VTLRNLLEALHARQRARDEQRWSDRYKYEIGELIAISRAVASERDLVRLLGLILEKSRYVTGADAGSIYIVEFEGGAPKKIRFMVSQNDSMAVDFREFTLPVDEQSMVGRTVVGRKILNIPDLQAGAVRHNAQLDRRSGYQTRSMLAVPLINQRDEVIGVVQLINKKRSASEKLLTPEDFDRLVVPFDRRSEELAETLASQTGISLENAMLYEEIQRLFEGFVNAAVTAIESRDPTTSGHSHRVASLTRGLAEVVDRVDTGKLVEVRFTREDLKQIEYAALLHDFGKVGVRENVLVKAKKLYDHDRNLVLGRFDYIRKSLEAESLRRRLERVVSVGAAPLAEELAAMEAALQGELARIDEMVSFILRSNEPTVLAEGSFERLADIAGLTYRDPSGEEQPWLTAGEMDALKVPRGSLTVGERSEIERHVVHTYQFLTTIPWARTLRGIPQIAGSHHEKLDGSGYPRGLKGDAIPVESRMMTIADIFDALTSPDRPYKRQVPLQKALDILTDEVKHGKCDAELFRLFIEAKVWTRVIPE
jgi:HD-GYP domain-containing protein (c-di-GMP phosphodiesterase class II)